MLSSNLVTNQAVQAIEQFSRDELEPIGYPPVSLAVFISHLFDGHSAWSPTSNLLRSFKPSIPDLPNKDTITMTFVDDLTEGALGKLHRSLIVGIPDAFIHAYVATQGQH